MAVAVAVLASILLWRDSAAWPYVYAVAALFLLVGLVFPTLLAPIEWLWMAFARVMGIIMTDVVLGIAYYLMVTPIGLIMRLIGRDPLHRKFDKKSESYWRPVDPHGTASRPEKPF